MINYEVKNQVDTLKSGTMSTDQIAAVQDLVGGTVDKIIELSNNVTENNIAKYEAQAKVLIEEMKTDIKNSEDYLAIRGHQQESFNQLVNIMHEESMRIIELVAMSDEVKSQALISGYKYLKLSMDAALNNLSEEIRNEQGSYIMRTRPKLRDKIPFFKNR